MVNKEENLNLKHNTDVLIRKAIERYKGKEEIANALGIKVRNLYDRINRMNDRSKYITKRGSGNIIKVL